MKKITSAIVTAEVIISVLLGLSNIIDSIPKIPPIYFQISIFVIIVSLLVYIVYLFSRKPWTKETRPYFFKFSIKPEAFKRLIAMFKEKPLYNSGFKQPLIESPTALSKDIKLEAFKKKISIIIEDDPVGFKKDFEIPAYFITEEMTANNIIETINADLEEIISIGIFFISTPSRRSSEENVIYIFRNIGQAIKTVFRNNEYRIISKIDSCLRSQYEPEYQGLRQGLHSFDCEVLAPSYIEEGRICVYGSSFLLSEKGNPIMLNKTEYSQVNGLKYKSSNIALWLEERTKNRIKRKKCSLVDINRIRSSSLEEIATFIQNRKHGKVLVFDLIDKDDIVHVRDAIIKTEEISNEVFFYKFGPSLINSFVDLYINNKNTADKPTEITKSNDRGVLFAGSLSSVTKKQVENLRNQADCSIILISNEELLDSRFLIDGVRQKADLIIARSRKDNTIIVTTEFWVEENTQYPDAEMRDKALDYFSNIAKLVNEEMDWMAFKGSDTAFNCLVYGIGIKKYYYCGHPVSGINKIKNAKNEIPYYIIGGNVGDTKLLLNFNNE